MNSRNYFDQDYNFESHDDDHDSEVESRLYAEIHYSNKIIGDDNDLSNSIINNESCNDSTTITSTTTMEDCVSSAKNSDVSAAPKNNSLENLINTNNTFDNSFIKQKACTNSGNLKEAENINVSNNRNKILRSQKRVFINDDVNESRELNKKQKEDNSNSTIEQTNNLLVSADNSYDYIRNQENKSQNKDVVINPYNKKSGEICHMSLLSPEFINLLFGNKNKSKKQKVSKKNQRKKLDRLHEVVQISEKNKLENNSVLNEEVQNDFHKTVDNKVHEYHSNQIVQNAIESISTFEQVDNHNLEIGCSNHSTIIDISSDSSNDCIENVSKYDNILQTDQKLKNKKSELQDENSEDSSSCSEESIFEVPVPPKPPPVLIDLNDSNSESECENKSENNSENENENILCQFPVIEAITNTEPLHNSVHETDLSNTESEICEHNIILNCTNVSKGVNSLIEIKQINHHLSNQKQYTDTRTTAQNEVSNERYVNNNEIYNLQNIINKQNAKSCNNKDLHGSKKVLSCTLNKKQQNNSCFRQSNIPVEEYFFQPMTDKMKQFYNDSWGGENFDLDYIKSKMSSDRKKWTILHEDAITYSSKNKRYFGLLCNRCQKYGHRTNQCKEDFSTPVCHMCGTKGHYETTCPHKKCLTCGKKQIMYRKTCESCRILICSRCDSRGHDEKSCPDLWRRYHQTVNQKNVPQNLNASLKPKFKLFCCNCAKRGHLSMNCNKLRWSQHFPIPSHIISYQGPNYTVNNTSSSEDPNTAHKCNSNLSSIGGILMDFNVISYNSNNSKSSYENLKDLKGNELDNNIHLEQEFTMYSKAKNHYVIFEVRSNNDMQLKRIRKSRLELKVPNIEDSSRSENWKGLLSFLQSFIQDVPSMFILQRKSNRIQMLIGCPNKYLFFLQQFIEQYASRNIFERSNMIINMNRDKAKIYNCINNKLEEIRNLMEDPLKLYEELLQLNTKVKNENQVNISLLNKLAVCEQKLLMSLLKNGFGTDSLLIWSKMLKKLKSKGKSKKQKAQELSIKDLLKYLYNYNRMFVSYQPNNLASLINNYKAHLERVDCLKNDLSLFPEKSMTASTSKQSCSSVNTSQEIPIPTILPINTSIANNSYSSIIQSATKKDNNLNVPTNTMSQQIKETQNIKKGKKNSVNGLYQSAVSCKNPLKRAHALKQFQTFIKNAKNLLTYACKLNIPELQKGIKHFQNKMKHEQTVLKSDYVRFKKFVEKVERKKFALEK